jgi:formylglycine-generating enzyme required for sulfatase activity
MFFMKLFNFFLMHEKNRFYFVWLLLYCLFVLTACSGSDDTSPTPAGISPPDNVTADVGDGSGKVYLNWSPVMNATTYNIYYSTLPGVTKANGIKIANFNSPFIFRGLTNDDPYYFVVTAVGANGESDISYEVSAVPSPMPPPLSPLNVRATQGNEQVALSWDPSLGATSYNIYYRTTSRVTKENGAKWSDATSPEAVTGLMNGTIYYFIVTALNANGESAGSFQVSAIPTPLLVPAAPTGLAAVEGDRQATLSWDPVDDATSYNIYYMTSVSVDKQSGFTLAGVTSTSTIVPNLTNNVQYYFVVTAVNSNGEGVESSPTSATPVASPPDMVMELIPEGTFHMGDPTGTVTYASPLQSVTVGAFLIDRYDVTYDLWGSVYQWAVVNGYLFDNHGKNGSDGIGTHMPVTEINWYDAVKWLNARSEKEGLTPAYYTDTDHTTVYRTDRVDLANDMVDWEANGYRLSTEAEWEMATRGGLDLKLYPWGDDPLTPDRANYNMGHATSVGIYPRNGYGLYDMAGNIWQWVWDRSSSDYTWRSDGAVDPHGRDTWDPDTSAGQTRVRRGGSYAYDSMYLQCHQRMFRPPTYKGPYFGFRCARNAP